MAAKAAGRDPWELVEEGACGKREVLVLADDILGQYVYEDLHGGSESEHPIPVALRQVLRVRPSDLAKLAAQRGPITVRRLLSASPGDEALRSPGAPDTREGWSLVDDLSVSPGVLLVRIAEPDARRNPAGPAGGTETITERRRAALLGVLAKMYCEESTRSAAPRRKDELLFKDGSVKVAKLIEHIQDRLSSDSGTPPRGFGKTKLRGHLDDALAKEGPAPESSLTEALRGTPEPDAALESDIRHGLAALADPKVIVGD